MKPKSSKTKKKQVSQIKIINKYDRKKLTEGKISGLGYCFAKKDGDTYTAVGPESSCKDYLSDVSYSEKTGKTITVYGYSAKPETCFTKDFGFLSIGILPENYSGGKHATFDDEVAYLLANYKKVEQFIRFFEDMLKLDNRTTITKAEIVEGVIGDRYLVEVPYFWCEFPYRISLYSLLLRICVDSFYDGTDALAILVKCKTVDSQYASVAHKAIVKMAEGKRPVQDLNYFSHYHGISYVYGSLFPA